MANDPFLQYAQRANSTQPAALIGPIKLRADARNRYSEIVCALNACESVNQLDQYLSTVRKELVQFQAELRFYWEGDGDFAGLAREIDRTRVRLDEGLDYPRYEKRN